ncbi:YkgJ family cysteine cluster protein [Candidatus Hodarchaeum mangrovi]
MRLENKNTQQELCIICGAKCCKPNLVKDPFNLNLLPGDFTKLLKKNFHVMIGTGIDERNNLSLTIKPHIFGYCIFLNYFTNQCQIYSTRPQICRRFPFDSSINSSVKGQCLILTTISLEKLNQIENKIIIKDNSKENLNLMKIKDEEDSLIYQDEYVPQVESYFSTKSYIQSKYGSFFISHNESFQYDLFNQLTALLENYRIFFNHIKVILSIGIVNSSNYPFLFIEGILDPINQYSQKRIFQEIEKKGNYYLSQIDGSYLEGLIYYDEIFEDPSHWHSCWEESRKNFKK